MLWLIFCFASCVIVVGRFRRLQAETSLAAGFDLLAGDFLPIFAGELLLLLLFGGVFKPFIEINSNVILQIGDEVE